MKNLLKALLIAGLFISDVSNASISIGGVDYLAGTRVPTVSTAAKCKTTISSVHGSINEEYFVKPEASNTTACQKASKTKFMDTIMSWHNNGRACPSQIKSQTDTGWFIQEYAMRTNGQCGMDGSGKAMSAGGTFIGLVETKKCPPDPSGQAGEDQVKQKYTLLLNGVNADGTQAPEQMCFKPLDPLDCSKLGGSSVTGQDYFITSNSGYSHPSCVTKCGTDANGQRQCGNCKVAAKSWTQTSLTTDGSIKKWSPLVGTFTGSACAATEQDEQPPNQEKCWQSRNGLKMCQQDPAEKCVTINGAQQCEAGCGYVNGDFFCKEGIEPTTPPKDDKPLPESDDSITNPEKPMADMVKGDFKDVQKGVESRLSVVSTGIGNLENSVDESNGLLTKIESNTSDALSDNQTQIGLLSDIKEALTGEGEGDGECDPEKDPNCANGGDAGTPASWWKSAYPQGMTGIIDDKRSQFQSSPAYESMTQEINIGSGTVQPWQFCFNASAMNFGCFDVEIPPYVLHFVRLCILFGAAILCRRLLIGA